MFNSDKARGLCPASDHHYKQASPATECLTPRAEGVQSIQGRANIIPRDDCGNQHLVVDERRTDQHATIDQHLAFGGDEIRGLGEVENVIAVPFEPFVPAHILDVPEHVGARDYAEIACIHTRRFPDDLIRHGTLPRTIVVVLLTGRRATGDRDDLTSTPVPTSAQREAHDSRVIPGLLIGLPGMPLGHIYLSLTQHLTPPSRSSM
jgi:hypothetical protein